MQQKRHRAPLRSVSLFVFFRRPAPQWRLPSPQDRFLQRPQILPVGVGQGTVEILDQRIQIRRMLRLSLQLHIPLPHGLRHPALTHIRSDHGIAGVDRAPGVVEDPLKIRLAAAEARRAEQEYPPVPQRFQQAHRGLIRTALVRPEADIQRIGIGYRRAALPEIYARLLRQRRTDRLRQRPRVACPAAEQDPIAFHDTVPFRHVPQGVAVHKSAYFIMCPRKTQAPGRWPGACLLCGYAAPYHAPS